MFGETSIRFTCFAVSKNRHKVFCQKSFSVSMKSTAALLLICEMFHISLFHETFDKKFCQMFCETFHTVDGKTSEKCCQIAAHFACFVKNPIKNVASACGSRYQYLQCFEFFSPQVKISCY